MAIPLTGSGSLFVRLGHILACYLDVNAARGSGVTAPDYSVLIPTKYSSNVIPDYAAGTADYPIIAGTKTNRGVTGTNLLSSQAAWQAAQGQHLTDLVSIMQATLIDMANADTPQASLALSLAMQLLVNQMTANAYYIAGSTVASGAQTNGTPTPTGAYAATGNSGPVVVVSVKDGHGYNLDNVLAETLMFSCTKDAQTGGQTKFQEQITLSSQPDLTGGDRNSYLWPSGSGVTNKIFTAVNAALNNSGGNLLQNGEFTAFTTANNPDNWVVLTGTVGTNFLSSSTGYQDNSSLELVGDGSTLVSICQKFNVTPTTGGGGGGTAANLLTLPDSPFAVNFWVKCSAVPAAGQLQVDLIDSTGTIINDDSGTANSLATDLTSTGLNTTSWANVNAVFRLPAVDPANTPVALRLWFPTGHALSSGKNVLVDRVSFTPMSQIYGPGAGVGAGGGQGGGPFVSVHSGNVAPILADFWTVAMTNTFGKWPQHFLRVFKMDQLGLRLPTSGSTLIATTLIA